MTSFLTLPSIHFSFSLPINLNQSRRAFFLLSRPRIPPKKQQQSIGVAQRVVSRLTCKAMAAGEGDKKPNGLVLLDFWVSPFGQRCRIALAEKGLEYEYSEQELLGGKKSELLLRSNPVHKKIPVLLHDGRTVNESLVILDYLDDAFPDAPPLLPSDPYARAQARFWAAYSDKVYETGTRLWKLKGEGHAKAREEMLQVLRNLEAELGDKAFFAGDGFGFLDVAVTPFTPWLPSYERYGEFTVPPRLAAWAARCAGRESVAKSLYPAEKVDEFITLLKKHFGIE
jgi:glutathione S-transferase